MKATFINTLTDLMEKNEDIVTVTADMGFSVFEDMQIKQPARFINSGVTEQASISVAAGIALSGYKVFFYAQASFATMRCFEQLHLDMAYNNLNIKVIGMNAGFSLCQLGVSHFSVEDVGIMKTLPNVTILTPGTPYEMKWALHQSYKIDGPVYLRYSKLQDSDPEKLPKIILGEPVELQKGTDAVLLVSGGIMRNAREVMKILEKKNLRVGLYSVPTIKPLNKKNIINIIKNTKAVFTLEEHSIIGGLGSTIAEIIAEENIHVMFHRLGIPDSFTSVTGTIDFLLYYNGLSPQKIAKTIQKTLTK